MGIAKERLKTMQEIEINHGESFIVKTKFNGILVSEVVVNSQIITINTQNKGSEVELRTRLKSSFK